MASGGSWGGVGWGRRAARVGGGGWGGGGRSPPPNAIAYGSGYIPMKGMIKAGFWLNVMGIGLLALLLTAIAHIFVR
ncbi:anion permease [Helicobacter bizzozeronii]|uniref:anion permease n=1 Tax=Helicobacter bizzozeronii TaxID=56877 RepID=UPI000CEDEB6A|nr:anion permease [Helicobacter bizzozeronii]